MATPTTHTHTNFMRTRCFIGMLFFIHTRITFCIQSCLVSHRARSFICTRINVMCLISLSCNIRCAHSKHKLPRGQRSSMLYFHMKREKNTSIISLVIHQMCSTYTQRVFTVQPLTFRVRIRIGNALISPQALLISDTFQSSFNNYSHHFLFYYVPCLDAYVSAVCLIFR